MNLPLFIGLRYTGAKQHNQLLSFLSGISIFGLALGVGLLIAVLSVMNGFDKELREKILALMPQGIIYHREGISDWPAVQRRIEQQAGVVAAAPFVELNGLVSHGTAAQPVVVYGLLPAQERRVSKLSEYLNDEVLSRLDEGGNNLVLGRALAEKLELQIGDQLMLVVPNPDSAKAAPKLEYFTLIAVLTTKTELDQSIAVTSLYAAAKLTGHPQLVSGMRLKLQDLFAARSTVWSTVLALGQGYYGNSWMTTHGNLYSAIQMSKNLVGLLMSLIVAIAAFNVVSTLVMVVVEKQGDIAILRTLGLSTGKIMQLFMVQGVAIGVLGTSLGVALGVFLSLVVESLVRWVETLFGVQFLKSDVYPLTYIPSEILGSDLLHVAGTTLLMSFLATLYPSWRASRVQPADALRYE